MCIKLAFTRYLGKYCPMSVTLRSCDAVVRRSKSFVKGMGELLPEMASGCRQG